MASLTITSLATTRDAVLAFLRGISPQLPAPFRGQPAVDAERLHSLANWVWKASFPDGSAAVVKQYGPHLSSDPSIVIGAERADVEWHALSAAHALSVQKGRETSEGAGATWGVPEPYFFDAANKVIVMEYVPCATLFAHLSTPSPSSSSSSSASTSGADLGPHLPWIADALAAFVLAMRELRCDRDLLRDTPVVRYYASQQALVGNVLARLPVDAPQQAALARAVTAERWPAPPDAPSDGPVWMYGDLWPQSVLLDVPRRRVVVVDWECVREGSAYHDLTQMAANLFLMAHGAPFHQPHCRELLALVRARCAAALKGAAAAAAAARGSDDAGSGTAWRGKARADLIYMVLTLVDYGHWGLSDKVAVIRAAAEIPEA